MESRRAALGAKRGDCETQDSYYEDISEDESIFELLAEEEQMLAEQLPSVDEEAKDGDISEAKTVVYQDDSFSMMRDSDDNTSMVRDSDDDTSMMRNSPFQDGDHSDNVSVHSDTSQDALRDNSEPAALVYSEISDDDVDVIPIVISEDELTVTQPESIRRVTKYFALRF